MRFFLRRDSSHPQTLFAHADRRSRQNVFASLADTEACLCFSSAFLSCARLSFWPIHHQALREESGDGDITRLIWMVIIFSTKKE